MPDYTSRSQKSLAIEDSGGPEPQRSSQNPSTGRGRARQGWERVQRKDLRDPLCREGVDPLPEAIATPGSVSGVGQD